MANSYLDSKATFVETLLEHGLADKESAFTGLGYTSIALFGGAHGYWPQCPGPSMQQAFRRHFMLPAAEMAQDADETGAVCAKIRRLFLECYTELQTDLHRRAQRTGDDPLVIKPTTQGDRNQRRQEFKERTPTSKSRALANRRTAPLTRCNPCGRSKT